jgi:raffinose/stachyose/melibiose transport system substrate-binding protein
MKKGMLKKGFLALSTSFLIFSLTACGGGQEKAASQPQVTELTLWQDWTEDRPENTVYKNLVDEFNKQNTSIHVKLESTPHDQYEVKLRTQAAGKELPDMFRVWPGARLTPLVKGGALMPLDPIVDNWNGLVSKEMLQGFAVDGKQYAIPSNVSETSLIFYHKSLLKQVGYNEVPKTYDDFKTLVQKLNAAKITPIALGDKGKWPLQSCYISTIADRLTGSDYVTNVLSGKAKFTDDRFVKALSVVDDLNKLHAFNEDMNTIDESQSRSYFIQGKTAMHVAGSWATGPILDGVKDKSDIGVTLFPSIAGGNGNATSVSGVVGGGIALSKNLSDQKKEAAFKFLKFFYGKDLYTSLLKANILVPAKVDVDSSVSDLAKETNQFAQGGLAPVYDASLTPELTNEINNGLQSITTGSMTPKQLADQMQQTVDSSK